VDEFWLKWYGHPPDGKAGFGVVPHRLYAFDAASSVLAGGIHWQNPKVSRFAGEVWGAEEPRIAGEYEQKTANIRMRSKSGMRCVFF